MQGGEGRPRKRVTLVQRLGGKEKTMQLTRRRILVQEQFRNQNQILGFRSLSVLLIPRTHQHVR